MKTLFLIAALSLSTAHAQEVHIYCGQGLSGCQNTPIPPAPDPGYKPVDGNANQVIMNGTHMIITYMADGGGGSPSYQISSGQNSRYADSLEAAILVAHSWSEELLNQGDKP